MEIVFGLILLCIGGAALIWIIQLLLYLRDRLDSRPVPKWRDKRY